jgi:large subunit ribosomal protein L9
MIVILTQDVRKLGRKGDTVSVSDGYGANYLIPRGLAVPSTSSSQNELKKANEQEAIRQKELKKEAEELSRRLEHIDVEFKAKAGSDGRMFGTISPKEIVEGMEKQWGIKLDKRKFVDKYPANAFGYTRLKIELYKGNEGEVYGVVNVHISEEK